MKKAWRLFGLWVAKDGLGAIEFAFVAPVLLAILLGVLDFGLAYRQQMEIANAADAGAQWAMANGYDSTKITNVATSATGLSGITVDPENPCGCVDSTTLKINTGYGTGLNGSPPCVSCPSGSTSGTAQAYVSVAALVCYKTLFSWPGLTYCSSGNSQCTSAGCSSSQVLLSSQSYVLQ